MKIENIKQIEADLVDDSSEDSKENKDGAMLSHKTKESIINNEYGNFEVDFNPNGEKSVICYWNNYNDLVIGREKKNAGVTFQSCMRIPLLFGQFLGLIPVQGILNDDVGNMRFNKKSVQVWFTLFLMLAQFIGVVLNIYRISKYSLNLYFIAGVGYYLRTCVSTTQFLRICTKWPNLMKEVADTESMEPLTDVTLKFRCSITTLTILLLGLLEYLLSIVANISEIICGAVHYGVEDLYDQYSKQRFPWIFELITEPGLFLKIFVQATSIQSLLNWNFSDLFIICMSLYLVSGLKQVNKSLLSAQGKYVHPQLWRKLREDYNRWTDLVRKFDDVINGVVFGSFASNVFYTCYQIFFYFSKFGKTQTVCRNSDQRIFGGYEFAIYYFFSLIYLMARFFAVSLIASRIHSATLEPAIVLCDVPSPVYCIEVQRFLDQVHGNTVALSGLRFFKVTRGIVLSVAATIVTYELVLLQFNKG